VILRWANGSETEKLHSEVDVCRGVVAIHRRAGSWDVHEHLGEDGPVVLVGSYLRTEWRG